MVQFSASVTNGFALSVHDLDAVNRPQQQNSRFDCGAGTPLSYDELGGAIGKPWAAYGKPSSSFTFLFVSRGDA